MKENTQTYWAAYTHAHIC